MAVDQPITPDQEREDELRTLPNASMPRLRTSESDIAQARIDLLSEMKVTRGCRFNAAKRLEKRDRKMITITAFASVYVIVLSVAPFLFPTGPTINNIITAVTIIFSLIILASSLLQYSNNDPVKAEQHHRCALEISALRRSLRAEVECSMSHISEYSRKYDDIIQKYGINHEDIDFDKYKADHPLEFNIQMSIIKNLSYRRKMIFESIPSMMGILTAAVITAAITSAEYRRVIDLVARLAEWIRSLLQN